MQLMLKGVEAGKNSLGNVKRIKGVSKMVNTEMIRDGLKCHVQEFGLYPNIMVNCWKIVSSYTIGLF